MVRKKRRGSKGRFMVPYSGPLPPSKGLSVTSTKQNKHTHTHTNLKLGYIRELRGPLLRAMLSDHVTAPRLRQLEDKQWVQAPHGSDFACRSPRLLSSRACLNPKP